MRYEADGERFIAVLKFLKHQHPRAKEAASTIPAPDLQSACTVLAPENTERAGLNPFSPLRLTESPSLNPEPPLTDSVGGRWPLATPGADRTAQQAAMYGVPGGVRQYDAAVADYLTRWRIAVCRDPYEEGVISTSGDRQAIREDTLPSDGTGVDGVTAMPTGASGLDWDYWLDLESWSLRDAVCLSLGLEPRSAEVKLLVDGYRPFTRYKGRDIDPLHDRLQQVADTFPLLGPNLSRSGDPWDDPVRPSEFATWTKKAGWDTPGHFELILYVDAMIASDEAPKSQYEKARTRSALTKERVSLLKLVFGMAIGGYGYNPNDKRSDTVSRIIEDLELQGLQIDEGTVRKFLRNAAKLANPNGS